ncbi:hypothetical protein [Aliiruegeria lutimaris]|uniref:Uncharacterized protein n=1 Tax=Aliiruegeria lutimaris TaxID=571298 RepID=A0A1G8VXZ3_9RHOB|nr:hypothetical protein [Aliiruegeria lutimaris]SDJ70707.1 hypothetical protein SAMN04488026_102269 [Aliiruegeria lutimaris]
MTLDQTGQRLVVQLSTANASDALPRNTRIWAERVLARLSAPVRVGILGREDRNLPSLANALLGEGIVPDGAGMPPMLVRHGTGDSITTVATSGARHEIRPEEFRKLDPWSLAMAEFSAPLALLDHFSLLIVPLEGGERDMEGAINWAGQRCDMAVFCARSADEPAGALWNRLPRPFLDHGFLCLLDEDSAARTNRLDHPFRSLFRVGTLAGDAAQIHRLTTALLDHVASARREDLEWALLLLERYCPPDRKYGLREVEPLQNERDEPDFAALLDPLPQGIAQHGDHADTSAPTAEIISFLAAQADELACLCETAEPAGPRRASSKVLALCTESIEACAEMAMQGEPEVMELFAEATDLVVLMQIESTTEAMTDAIALMLQLRHECESRLCA